jgi:hypothetical protein
MDKNYGLFCRQMLKHPALRSGGKGAEAHSNPLENLTANNILSFFGYP